MASERILRRNRTSDIARKQALWYFVAKLSFRIIFSITILDWRYALVGLVFTGLDSWNANALASDPDSFRLVERATVDFIEVAIISARVEGPFDLGMLLSIALAAEIGISYKLLRGFAYACSFSAALYAIRISGNVSLSLPSYIWIFLTVFTADVVGRYEQRLRSQAMVGHNRTLLALGAAARTKARNQVATGVDTIVDQVVMIGRQISMAVDGSFDQFTELIYQTKLADYREAANSPYLTLDEAIRRWIRTNNQHPDLSGTVWPQGMDENLSNTILDARQVRELGRSLSELQLSGPLYARADSPMTVSINEWYVALVDALEPEQRSLPVGPALVSMGALLVLSQGLSTQADIPLVALAPTSAALVGVALVASHLNRVTPSKARSFLVTATTIIGIAHVVWASRFYPTNAVSQKFAWEQAALIPIGLLALEGYGISKLASRLTLLGVAVSWVLGISLYPADQIDHTAFLQMHTYPILTIVLGITLRWILESEEVTGAKQFQVSLNQYCEREFNAGRLYWMSLVTSEMARLRDRLLDPRLVDGYRSGLASRVDVLQQRLDKLGSAWKSSTNDP